MIAKSKKDLLVLGLIGVGAIALASQVVDTKKDTKKMRMGGGGFPIGGIPQKESAIAEAPSIEYVFHQPEIIFPAPTFDVSRNLTTSRPTEIYAPPLTPVSSHRRITGAFERLRASGFDPSTTFTGTPTSPAFVQRDIYHKKMIKELGLNK